MLVELLLGTTGFWLEQHKNDNCEINSGKKQGCSCLRQKYKFYYIWKN
jgi:hypothetical protein